MITAIAVVLILAVVAALAGVVYVERRTATPIDWAAPATDLADVDQAEARHWDAAERRAPIVWSDTARGWVCAARAEGLPGGICAWRAVHGPCPDHGRLIVPDPTAAWPCDREETDPDAAYEHDVTGHDYWAGA
ncbi:hypothetical protein [Actinoallomurus sp. CA-142502]|uniref:hypothetical protein n=1 Tax=Actinoallomurus sp. CA-142502 TaxID=3239885 RepID=UPI003D8F1A6B